MAGKFCPRAGRSCRPMHGNRLQGLDPAHEFSGTPSAPSWPGRRAAGARVRNSGRAGMGIFNALSTAVSGLNAQSFALDNISGNIANAGTVGYKRNDTSFQDLITYEGNPQYQVSGSVQALTQSTNSVQGGVETSDVATNMAINGDGYFIIGNKGGTTDGTPTFGTQSLYTRRGDFTLDKNGYLVNGAGYYLKSLPIDPTTGNPSSSVPVPIQLTDTSLPARQTQTITYRANLPQFPLTADADA